MVNEILNGITWWGFLAGVVATMLIIIWYKIFFSRKRHNLSGMKMKVENCANQMRESYKSLDELYKILNDLEK